jgi:hypothetical protein
MQAADNRGLERLSEAVSDALWAFLEPPAYIHSCIYLLVEE